MLCSALLINSEDDKTGDVTRFYETGAHGTVSRSLLHVSRDTDGRDLYDVIDEYRMNLPPGKKPLWMVRDVVALSDVVMWFRTLSGSRRS